MRHAAPAIGRVHRDRFQVASAPIDSSDAVARDPAAGTFATIFGDQEKFRTGAPIREEEFRLPGVLAEGSPLDFGHAPQIAALESADFYV